VKARARRPTGRALFPMSDIPFLQAFRGSFRGVLRWEQLDALWVRLRAEAEAGWYIYHVGDAPPATTVDPAQLDTFLREVDGLLRSEHLEDYCGIVYADDFEQPRFVKIFDPHNLGVSCGFSTNPPLPGWVLSTIPPVDLPTALPPTGNRRRWWQRVFG